MPTVSLAIETTCRAGGVALGVGDELRRVIDFDASSRHATQLIVRLRDLLAGEGLTPADVSELYVSAGPGSFTGTRVGVTVGRNILDRPWQHAAVVLDAKEECVYAVQYERDGDDARPAAEPAVLSVADFLAGTPRPIVLVGEGLGYHDLSAEGVEIAFPGDPPANYPTARSVWHVGREMARREQFTEYHHLLPIYVRQPEAVRVWEKKHAQ